MGLGVSCCYFLEFAFLCPCQCPRTAALCGQVSQKLGKQKSHHGDYPEDPKLKEKAGKRGPLRAPRRGPARRWNGVCARQGLQPWEWCQRKGRRQGQITLVQGGPPWHPSPGVWGQGSSSRQGWRPGSFQLGWNLEICWGVCLISKAIN